MTNAAAHETQKQIWHKRDHRNRVFWNAEVLEKCRGCCSSSRLSNVTQRYVKGQRRASFAPRIDPANKTAP